MAVVGRGFLYKGGVYKPDKISQGKQHLFKFTTSAPEAGFLLH
jgi:hypothetical protein